jgi:hypothetical protein
MNTEHPPFDFGLPAPDRRPVTIRVTRPMLLRSIGDKDLVHIAAGSVVTITRHDLALLDPGDWQPGGP